MKIYLAHSLTQAPEEFKSEMLKLRAKLQEKYEVLVFKGLVDGTLKEVYEHDVLCVKDCDLLLADVTYPAIGLGFEIATGLELGKKVVAVAKEGAKVSRLVLGIDKENYTFRYYKDLNEILDFIV